MDKLVERLNAWGCDTEGALERFLDNEEMYVEFVNMSANDNLINELGEKLKNNNIKEAFEIAHNLKGVYGNLGLTPMYEKIIEIVEPLRKEKIDGVYNNYKILVNDLNELKKML